MEVNMEVNMDINVISQLITSVGFPIVACCAMFYVNYTSFQKHEEEMKNVIEAINNNTMAINELKNKWRD